MAENETKPDEQPKENADNTNETKKPKQRTWPALLLIVCIILGTASAAVVMASIVIRPAPQKVEETVAAQEQDASESKDTTLCEFVLEEPLIVNVYQTQQRRYLSVKPVLVLKGKAALEKMTAKQVELQHLLIGILKHKTLEQLDDPDVANSIGREVQEMANLNLDVDAAVESVYFTQFVVQ